MIYTEKVFLTLLTHWKILISLYPLIKKCTTLNLLTVKIVQKSVEYKLTHLQTAFSFFLFTNRIFSVKADISLRAAIFHPVTSFGLSHYSGQI